LKNILRSEERLKEVVSDELTEVAKEFGTKRKTLLLEEDSLEEKIASQPLEVQDTPCFALLSASGRLGKTKDTTPLVKEGRSEHDLLLSSITTTGRADIGLLDSQGIIHRIHMLDLPLISASNETRISLTHGLQAEEIISHTHPICLLPLDTQTSTLAIATAYGKIKRLNISSTSKDSWEGITLEENDYVIGAFLCNDEDEISLLSNDGQLLHFSASLVRPQGRTGQGIAGIRLKEGARVIALGVCPSDDISACCVATIAGNSAALAGTEPGSAKITPLDRFPSKGRGTGGVRAQRFLKGEDVLINGAIGTAPLLAMSASGKPLDLPEIEEKRDASGTPLESFIAHIASI
ncbi:MAG: DNA topoisomerase IV, partial [Actinomycetaceae bacterium]|nr:DNA topoisomerase IV [Actinomycetaceae bacterium]